MSKNTLIIGAGGVGNVVAFKCAMNADTPVVLEMLLLLSVR